MAKSLNHLRRHARTRAFERYDEKLTRKDLSLMERLILDEQASFVVSRAKRAKEFLVPYRARTFRVLFDTERRLIITFFHLVHPKEASA